MYTVILF